MMWLERTNTEGADIRLLDKTYNRILIIGEDAGLNAIVAGGYFPGPLLLHYQSLLFVADTIFAVPSTYSSSWQERGNLFHILLVDSEPHTHAPRR